MPAVPVAKMLDQDVDEKKSTPHGSPKPEPDATHEKPPSPAMQSASTLPHQQQHHTQHHHQHHQHQYYPQPNGQHLPSPDYRGSPPGAVPMSLPPIQHFEGVGMQPQYIPAGHMNGASHMPPYNPSMAQYQAQPMPPTMPSNAPNGHNGMMRYPIPPHASMDARQMSGGRHKKEIKRRTKSGCLTCRKRRIKCDEAQPTCNNCRKSKRDCMGYDPIFKNNSATPASIQPAPVSSAPSIKTSPTMSTVPSNSYPPYHGAGGGTFIHQLPHTASPLETNMYHTSVDSVLADGDAKVANVGNGHYSPAIQTARRFTKITIDELFDLNDIPPQLPMRSTPDLLSPEVNKDLESFYTFQYAHALDKLFETSWYTTRGFATLTADHNLSEFAVQCMEEMRAKSATYGTTPPMPALPSLEARLVWSLAVMPRTQHLHGTGGGGDPLTLELLPRLDTVENLITGRYIDASRAPPPPTALLDGSTEGTLKANQQAFWYHLGKFTALRDDLGDMQILEHVSMELANMRMILNMLENRDVFYSIAVARHIGGRMPDWSPQTSHVSYSNDPNDDAHKLHVAHGFVQTEDRRGTNQVISRICSMSLRAWSLQRHQQ